MRFALRLVVLTLATAWCASVGAAPPGSPGPAKKPPATQPATKPGTTVRFFGIESQGKRIVFVCDATGTMINKFRSLRDVLGASVDAMDPGQAFNVVLFHDGPKFTQLNPLPLAASPANKAKVQRFFDGVKAKGTTDPLPALEAAFKQKPDVIYLMTDGEFNNLRSYDEVTNAITRMNTGRRTRVNTVLFEGFNEEAAEVLAAIAHANGGQFGFVKEEDLAEAKRQKQ